MMGQRSNGGGDSNGTTDQVQRDDVHSRETAQADRRHRGRDSRAGRAVAGADRDEWHDAWHGSDPVAHANRQGQTRDTPDRRPRTVRVETITQCGASSPDWDWETLAALERRGE